MARKDAIFRAPLDFEDLTKPDQITMKLADILNQHWDPFAAENGSFLRTVHHRAAHAVRTCRTGELGAHLYECVECGTSLVQLNSCQNRACPQCGALKQQQWAEKQEAKLLDADYLLITFPLPAALRSFCYANQEWFYSLFFDAVRCSIRSLDLGKMKVLPLCMENPDTLGFFSVLQTWARDLIYHPHIHVVMPLVALSADGEIRKSEPGWSFPNRALAARFKTLLRRKLLSLAESRRIEDFDEGLERQLEELPENVWSRRWDVDVQPIGNGVPAVRYLARFIQHTAIDDQSIQGLDSGGRIRLRVKGRLSAGDGTLALQPFEFLRRWCMHILPSGLKRVRHYGFLSPKSTDKYLRVRESLAMPRSVPESPAAEKSPLCECCKCPMILSGIFTRDGKLCPVKKPSTPPKPLLSESSSFAGRMLMANST